MIFITQVTESDLERAEERGEMGETKIMELEEELKVMIMLLAMLIMILTMMLIIIMMVVMSNMLIKNWELQLQVLWW